MTDEIRTTATEQDATPAGTEGQEQGRTFTQDEVNAIVRDRLAREREKATPQDDERERDLSARESRLDCREYINENKYPAALLDVFDTSNAEAFKESVKKLVNAFPQITSAPRQQYAPSNPAGDFYTTDPIAAAFK